MARAKKIGRGKGRLYKKYVAHMSDPHKKERFKIFIDGVALSLPLLIAFSLYISIFIGNVFPTASSAGSGMYLSPDRIEPIVITILFFIVAYSIFLMIEYNILRKRLAKVKKSK